MEIIIKNQIVLIDEEDYERVIEHTWNIGSQGYPFNSKMKTTLHQFLIGKKEDLIIDHINGNKLDNRKENLRHTTYHVNNKNREMKGYTFDKSRGKWKVMLTLGNDGKRHQKRFSTEEEAKNYADKMIAERNAKL